MIITEYRPDPIRDIAIREAQPGGKTTLAAVALRLGIDWRADGGPAIIAEYAGLYWHPAEWDAAVVVSGQVVFRAHAAGGGNSGAIIGGALIVIGAVASIWSGPVGVALIATGAGMLAGSLIKPPTIPTPQAIGERRAGSTATGAAGNPLATASDRIPDQYGRMRWTPPLIERVTVEDIADDMLKLRYRLCLGHGDLQVHDVLAGDTPITGAIGSYQVSRPGSQLGSLGTRSGIRGMDGARVPSILAHHFDCDEIHLNSEPPGWSGFAAYTIDTYAAGDLRSTEGRHYLCRVSHVDGGGVWLGDWVHGTAYIYTDGVALFDGEEAYTCVLDHQWRGAWATATAYAIGDIVSDSGSYYRCTTAHTSGATFAGDSAYWVASVSDGTPGQLGDTTYWVKNYYLPSLESTHWDEFSQLTVAWLSIIDRNAGTWAAGTSYSKRDIVDADGAGDYQRALQNHTSGDTFDDDAAKWEAAFYAGTYAPAIGDVIAFFFTGENRHHWPHELIQVASAGGYAVCISEATRAWGGSEPDSGLSWPAFLLVDRGSYANANAYLAGDYVASGGDTWRCLIAHENVGAWAPSTAYAVGDIVERVVGMDTLYYRCITAHTSSAMFSTDSAYWVASASDGTPGGGGDATLWEAYEWPDPRRFDDPANLGYGGGTVGLESGIWSAIDLQFASAGGWGILIPGGIEAHGESLYYFVRADSGDDWQLVSGAEAPFIFYGQTSGYCGRADAVGTMPPGIVKSGPIQLMVARADTELDRTQALDQLQWIGAHIEYSALDPAPLGDVTIVEAIIDHAQLAEQVQGVRVLATRMLPIYDEISETWSAPTATRNPGWAVANILRASYSAGKSADDFDFASVLHFASTRDTLGFYADIVLRDGTRFDALGRICAAGRAKIIVQRGRESVVVDDPQTAPVGIFTPATMLPDSLEITQQYRQPEDADGVSVSYVDSATWESAEYATTADGGAPDAPATIPLDAVTDATQAQAIADFWARRQRYPATQAAWRCEMDAMLWQPGDMLRIAHDQLQRGSATQLIGEISSGVYRCSEPISWPSSGPISCALRAPDGDAFVTDEAAEVPGDPYAIDLSGVSGGLPFTPVLSAADGEQTSCIVAGTDSMDVIVLRILPAGERTWTIAAAQYDQRIYPELDE